MPANDSHTTSTSVHCCACCANEDVRLRFGDMLNAAVRVATNHDCEGVKSADFEEVRRDAIRFLKRHFTGELMPTMGVGTALTPD